MKTHSLYLVRMFVGALLLAAALQPTAAATAAALNEGSADLALTKTVSHDHPMVGEAVQFTVTISNSGDWTAGIKVRDALSGSCAEVIESATPSRGSVSGSPATGLTWTLDLDTGDTATLKLWVRATCASSFTNTARIQSSGSSSDSSGGNNQDSVTVHPRAVSDIGVTKSVTMNDPVVGQRITFTLTATNHGQATWGVVIGDLFADPSACFSPTGPPVLSTGTRSTRASRSVWILDLPAGASATLEQTGFVSCATAFTNTATVESGGSLPDGNPDNDKVQVIVRPSQGKTIDLEVQKIVDHPYPLAGDIVTFTITLSNNTADKTGRIFPTNFARDIQVKDYLPHGLTFLDASVPAGTFDEYTRTWYLDELGPEKTTSISIRALVEAEGEYINCAEVWDADMPDRDSFTGAESGGRLVSVKREDDEDCAGVWAGPLLTDLEVTKVVSDPSPVQDDTITYSITVTNRALEQGVAIPTADATQLVIADYLPAGQLLIPESVTTGGGNGISFDPHTFAWTIDRLPAGKTLTLRFDAVVSQPGEFYNCAEVHAVNEIDRDSQSAVQAGGALAGHYEDDQDCVTIWVTPRRPDLELTKSVSNLTPRIGDYVTYNLTLTNRQFEQGVEIPTATATNIVVKDYLPAGLWYQEGSATDSDNTGALRGISFDRGDFSWHIDELLPGKALSLAFRVRIDTDGDLRNCAEVWDADQGDRDSRSGAESYGELRGGPGAEDDQDCVQIWVDRPAEPTGSVSGFVYLDANRSGYQDYHEVGLPGFEVDLVEIGYDRTCGTFDDVEVATIDTDKNGAYTFWDVDPGEYCVRILDVTIPAGYFRTSSARVPVWVGSGRHVAGVSFGFRQSYPSYPLPRASEALCYLVGPSQRLTAVESGAPTDALVFDHAIGDVEAMAFHPWSGSVYTSDGSGLSIIESAGGSVRRLGEHGSGTGVAGEVAFDAVSGIAFDPFTGTLFAAAVRDGAPDVLFQMDLTSGRALRGAFASGGDYLLLDSRLGDVRSIALDPVDGGLYVLGAVDRTTAIARLDRDFGTVLRIIPVPEDRLESISFFNNGTLYASGSDEAPVLLAIDLVSGSVSVEATLGMGEFGTTGLGIGYGEAGGPAGPGLAGTDDMRGYGAVSCLTGSPNQLETTLFADANGDGLRQETELGLADIGVDLFRDTNSNGTIDTQDLLVAEALSGDNGMVRFSAASNGDFLMQIATSTLPFGAHASGTALPAAAGSFGMVNPAGDMALTGVTATTSEDPADAGLPERFELGANYPNPFNPQTTIAFAAPRTGRVSVAVFDVLGRQVAVLIDGIMQAGRHEVTFNAERLPSGTYFARMIADGVVQTRSMILVK